MGGVFSFTSFQFIVKGTPHELLLCIFHKYGSTCPTLLSDIDDTALSVRPTPRYLDSISIIWRSRLTTLICEASSLARDLGNVVTEKLSVSGWLALGVAIVTGPIGLYYAYKSQELAYESTMIAKWTAKKDFLTLC